MRGSSTATAWRTRLGAPKASARARIGTEITTQGLPRDMSALCLPRSICCHRHHVSCISCILVTIRGFAYSPDLRRSIGWQYLKSFDPAGQVTFFYEGGPQ